MRPGQPGDSSGHTVDPFLGGLVTLAQPIEGHRAGLDAALLQAVVPADASGHAIDLGAGVGTIALALAARVAGLEVTAVERVPALVALGRQALGLPANARFAGRVSFIESDVAQAADQIPGKADWVLMNPPFDDPGRMRPSPNPSKRAAHSAAEGLLAAWTDVAAHLLQPGGRLALIHRAEDLAHIAVTLARRFGDIRMRPIHPAADRPAIRVLVQARLGRRAPLTLLPGLILHRSGGGWTPEVDALLRGEAALPL